MESPKEIIENSFQKFYEELKIDLTEKEKEFIMLLFELLKKIEL